MNELRSHMTSADSEKVEMQEKIRILDTDITSKQVCCTIIHIYVIEFWGDFHCVM